MIWILQFYGGSQDIQYIHALIMDPEFGLMDNIMPQMMLNLSQILNLKLSKGDPGTPTLTDAVRGPYKAQFIQAMNQEIK